MKKSFNFLVNCFSYLVWGVAILVVVSDAFGALAEILSSGSYKYHNFTKWHMFNQAHLLFMTCIVVLSVIAGMSLYCSYKNLKNDKLKAILIMLIPLLLYNVFAFVNLR